MLSLSGLSVFVSLVCAIHLIMDSLLSGASKGARGIQSEQTSSLHRCHSLSLALYDWLTKIIQLKFPLVFNEGTMHPLLSLCVFWLLPLALTLDEDSPLDCVPRRSVPFDRESRNLSCVTVAYKVSACVDSYAESLGWPFVTQSLITCGW